MRLNIGLFKTLDERLNLGRISFRNVIAIGHLQSPRAKSIGQTPTSAKSESDWIHFVTPRHRKETIGEGQSERRN
jgi:hypothetical protein